MGRAEVDMAGHSLVILVCQRSVGLGGMDSVVPISSVIPGPFVQPLEHALVFPLRGNDDEIFRVTVNNPSEHRIAFKITSTKMACFQVKPTFAIIEGKNSRDVEFVPKPITTTDGWNKFDKIQVHVCTAPKGNLWKASEIWAKNPKDTKTFTVNLTAAYEGGVTPPRPKPKPVPKPAPMPPPPMPIPRQQSRSLRVAEFRTEPYVEPLTATISLPCKGKDDDNIEMTIHNPMQMRFVWRIKGSKMQHFIAAPKWGFLEAESKEVVHAQPKPIANVNAFDENDHFLILLANGPNGNQFSPGDLWQGKTPIRLEINRTMRVKIRALVQA